MYTVSEKKIEGQYSKWLVRDESLNLKTECPTESDARAIADALNMAEALDDVRGKVDAEAEKWAADWWHDKQLASAIKNAFLGGADCALAALKGGAA